MTRIERGRARRLGDGINTDYIVSSSRKKSTLDPHALKVWLLEGVDPGFAATVEPGDMLVAGRGFGSGSAMEVAVTVVLAAGIRVVVAESFSRTYFRNALNNGLWPIECDTSAIEEGDRLRVELDRTRVRVANERTGRVIEAQPLSDFALQLLDAGGLVGLVRRHGALRAGR